MDYGDFVVHVFLDEKRSYYDLERLWGDAPRVDWESGSTRASRPVRLEERRVTRSEERRVARSEERRIIRKSERVARLSACRRRDLLRLAVHLEQHPVCAWQRRRYVSRCGGGGHLGERLHLARLGRGHGQVVDVAAVKTSCAKAWIEWLARSVLDLGTQVDRRQTV